MASGEINASSPEIQQSDEIQVVEVDIHVGVFFDGTNNNANNNTILDWFKFRHIVEKNHVLNNTIGSLDRGLSNPALLSALFTKKESSEDGCQRFIHAYIEGSGTNGFQAKNGAVDFIINGKPVIGLGFGVGPTGVVAKVSKAIRIIGDEIEKIALSANTHINSIHFYVFGFSRGSTCARLFSYMVARSKDDMLGPLKRKEESWTSRNVESEFDKYLGSKYFKNGQVFFLKDDHYKTSEITVDFLGIYDTVSAIGFLREVDETGKDVISSLRLATVAYSSDFWDNFHSDNAEMYGLYSPSLSSVKSTCHICAMDEFRANFALTDIGESVNKENNIELFLPGCHSDIGGGYYIGDEVERKTLKIIEGNRQSKFLKGALADCSAQWTDLKYSLLCEMGWIVNNGSRNEMVSIGYDLDQETKVVFDHQPVYSSYSNITLKFMYERMKKQVGDMAGNLFGDIPDGRSLSAGILSDIYKRIEPALNKNGRFFYVPHYSKNYITLRQDYLHFTASDKIHSGGDIGNLPANRLIFMSDGTVSRYITRYVYRGGREHDNNIHYMDEYNDITRL